MRKQRNITSEGICEYRLQQIIAKTENNRENKKRQYCNRKSVK